MTKKSPFLTHSFPFQDYFFYQMGKSTASRFCFTPLEICGEEINFRFTSEGEPSYEAPDP